MYRFTAKSVAGTVKRSVGLLTRFPFLRPSLVSSPPLSTTRHRISSFNEKRLFTTNTKIPENFNESQKNESEEDCSHISWWKKNMEMCRKPSALKMIKRLTYSNLLGLDENDDKLRELGLSLEEGTYAWKTLQFKARCPRHVLLRKFEGSYEAVGFDACILLEYSDDAHQFRANVPQVFVYEKDILRVSENLQNNGFQVTIGCRFEPRGRVKQESFPYPSYESHEEEFELFWKGLAKNIWTEGKQCDSEPMELCMPGEKSVKFFIPPPSQPPSHPTTHFTCVYVKWNKPDKAFSAGQTEDMRGHLREERSKMGENELLVYYAVPHEMADEFTDRLTTEFPDLVLSLILQDKWASELNLHPPLSRTELQNLS